MESVAVNSAYLEYFFPTNLEKPETDWATYFQAPLRCRISTSGESDEIPCGTLGGDTFVERPFDYPTFNPLWKMNPAYSYFYAVAASSRESRWLDSVIKVDVKNGDAIVAEWSAPGVFVAEADFFPFENSSTEDDGLLLTLIYNVTDQTSSLGVLWATNLTLVEQLPLGGFLPFQAHGIVCPAGGACYSNP